MKSTIVNYIYVTAQSRELTEAKVHGPYECDREDLRAFFDHKPEEMYYCRVTEPQGDFLKVYTWTRAKGWCPSHVTKAANNEFVAKALCWMIIRREVLDSFEVREPFEREFTNLFE